MTAFIDLYLRAASAAGLSADLAAAGGWLAWPPGSERLQGAGWALDPIGAVPASPLSRDEGGVVAMAEGWHANLRLYGVDAAARAAALWAAHGEGMAAGSEVLGAQTVNEAGARSTLYGAPPATPARVFGT